MGVRWASDTTELFCATEVSVWGSKRHLVVVALPEGGGWDWAAWSCDGTGCMHGRAASADAAMRAAETGAAQLARRTTSLLAAMPQRPLYMEGPRAS